MIIWWICNELSNYTQMAYFFEVPSNIADCGGFIHARIKSYLTASRPFLFQFFETDIFSNNFVNMISSVNKQQQQHIFFSFKFYGNYFIVRLKSIDTNCKMQFYIMNNSIFESFFIGSNESFWTTRPLNRQKISFN